MSFDYLKRMMMEPPRLSVTGAFLRRRTAGGASIGNGLAKMSEVRGNSAVWNQLVQNGNFADASGWNPSRGTGSVANNKYTFTKGAEAGSGVFIRQSLKATQGHKVLVSFHATASEAIQINPGFYVTNDSSFLQSLSANTRTLVQGIVTITANGASGFFRVYLPLTEGGTCVFEDVNVIDLTQMLTDSLYTTPELFRKDYPLAYYAYNNGQVLGNSAEKLKSADEDDVELGEVALNIPTLTGKVNGEGSSVTIFADGMHGNGSVWDSLLGSGGYLTRAVKRWGKVDLGSLTWYYGSEGGHEQMFSLPLAGIKYPANDTTIANIICRKYVATSYNNVYSHISDNIISINAAGRVRLYSSTMGTDAATFKSAMSGVYLYYELANPIEYVLDAPINGKYIADNLGTEWILPENTATPTLAPFKATIKYKK